MENFWAKVRKESNDCWTWLGNKTSDGYGQFFLNGRNVGAHRYAFESILNRIIPSGLELDHLCRNRACVNPDHMEIVTHQENSRRGRSYHASLTHCPQGHPYDLFNTYFYGGRGGRRCKTCLKLCNARRSRQFIPVLQ